jgi:hypothetical protein
MIKAGRKPREPRRRVNAPAWISYDGGFGVLRCMLVNMSRGGAWLRVDDAARLPNSFNLMFQQGSRDGKKCRVVWRSADTVGVKFIA